MLSSIVRSIPRCSHSLVNETFNAFQCASRRLIYTVSRPRLLFIRNYKTYYSESEKAVPELDRLFTRIHLELRGHDKAVLKSYTTFLQTACHHLSVKCGPVQTFPYIRWIIPLLRSKFAKKKYKLHYETRTHIRRMTIEKVTGSTASTYLEYVQRNIPEGVAMKVTYEEAVALPDMISRALQRNQISL